MVRIFLILFLITFLSCSKGIYLEEGGLRPKKYHTKNYNRFISDFRFDSSSILDTINIYISDDYFKENNLENDFVKIYKFFNDGKCLLFYIKKSEIKNLNSKMGYMGFYEFEANNIIETYFFVSTTGGHKFHKSKLYVFNDSTISETQLKAPYSKKFLNFSLEEKSNIKPDW